MLLLLLLLLASVNWQRVTYRNADCYVNTVDEKITIANNLVNYGRSVTHEILWLIWMGGECT